MEEVNYDLFCAKCKMSVEGGFKGFQTHLKRKDHVPPFICGQGGCANDFAYRRNLYEHIRKNHPAAPPLVLVAPVAPVVVETDESDDDTEDHPAQVFHHEDMADRDLAMVQEQASEAQDEGPVDLARSAELAVLKLRSVTYMTGTALESVENQAYSLLQDSASLLKGKVEEYLSKPAPTAQDKEYLLQQFSLPDPFQKLKTKEQQMKIFKSKYGLIESKEMFLGHRYDSRQHPQRPRLESRQLPRSFQCIKIEDILRAVLSDPYLRDLIMNEKASNDEYMRSFRDGLLFSEVPADLKNAVRIIVYVDDLEILQALSPTAGVYKIAGVYFCIQNLPPEMNALLSYIFVTILAFADDTRDELVWKPFLDAMKKLETEGLEVMIDGVPVIFKVFLVAQVGDSLAAAEVLGFRRSSANLFCRRCYINRRDMWINGLQVGEPRTPERHAIDVQMATSEANKKASGVDGPSMIHGLSFFEPVTHSVFDIFHDLLQGVNKMEVKLALRYYVIEKKYFTIQELNSRVQFFDYGFVDKKNKPGATFTEDYLKNISSYNLRQTGSQMWCLTRAFPFLFADLVPDDDPFMNLISLLNRIMTIVFSHAVSEGDLETMDDMIKEHHKVFCEIFPNRPSGTQEVAAETEQDIDDPPVEEESTLQAEHRFQDFHHSDSDTEDSPPAAQPQDSEQSGARQQKRKKSRVVRMINKHHHMLHYKELMKQMGPLVLYWCARYEARHYFFKLVATVCHNFINPLKTLMEMLVMKLAADKEMPRSRLIMGVRGTKQMTVDSSLHVDQLLSVGLTLLSKIYCVHHVMFNGVDYRPELFVVLSLASQGSHPEFGRIESVYVSEGQDSIYLIVKKWRTERFASKYCAYEVSPVESTLNFIITPSHLPVYRLMGIWKRYDSHKLYLAPRTVA